jgi:hypothetical protein
VSALETNARVGVQLHALFLVLKLLLSTFKVNKFFLLSSAGHLAVSKTINQVLFLNSRNKLRQGSFTQITIGFVLDAQNVAVSSADLISDSGVSAICKSATSYAFDNKLLAVLSSNSS